MWVREHVRADNSFARTTIHLQLNQTPDICLAYLLENFAIRSIHKSLHIKTFGQQYQSKAVFLSVLDT